MFCATHDVHIKTGVSFSVSRCFFLFLFLSPVHNVFLFWSYSDHEKTMRMHVFKICLTLVPHSRIVLSGLVVDLFMEEETSQNASSQSSSQNSLGARAKTWFPLARGRMIPGHFDNLIENDRGQHPWHTCRRHCYCCSFVTFSANKFGPGETRSFLL